METQKQDNNLGTRMTIMEEQIKSIDEKLDNLDKKLDKGFTIGSGVDGAAATFIASEATGTRIKTLDITAKTTYYINFLQDRATTTSVGCKQRYVRATCAYL